MLALISSRCVQMTSLSPAIVSTDGGIITLLGANFGPYETAGLTWASIQSTGIDKLSTGESARIVD